MTTTGETVKLELTPYEAELFMAFRKHQDQFEVLREAGVFDVRNGKAVLSFDSAGTLQDIDFDIKGYKRGHAIIQVIHRLR